MISLLRSRPKTWLTSSLDVSSVANHELDEGVSELLRLRSGGRDPRDGCCFAAQPYAGAAFPRLAASVIDDSSNDTLLSPYSIKDIDFVKVGFIGLTLQATAGFVITDATSGLTFLEEAATVNSLVPELADQGVEAIVVLLHQGATLQDSPGDINSCAGISGPIVAINAAPDPTEGNPFGGPVAVRLGVGGSWSTVGRTRLEVLEVTFAEEQARKNAARRADRDPHR